MNKAIPWSIKGVDFETREAAKDAARRSGMTLGQWLNSVIEDRAEDMGLDADELDDEDRSEAVHTRLGRARLPRRPVARARSQATSTLDKVARRLENLESHLAEREAEDEALQSSIATIESRLGAIGRRRETGGRTDTALRGIERRLNDLSERMSDTQRPAPRLPFPPASQAPPSQAPAPQPAAQYYEQAPQFQVPPFQAPQFQPPHYQAPQFQAPVFRAPYQAPMTPAVQAPAVAPPRAHVLQPPSLASLREAVAQISNRQRDLDARFVSPAATPRRDSIDRYAAAAAPVQRDATTRELEALRRQVEDLARGLNALVPRDQISAIESAVRDIGRQIKVQPPEGAGDSITRPMEELTSQVRRTLAEIPARTTIENIERSLSDLGAKLEAMRNLGIEPGTLREILSKANEIRGLVATVADRPNALEKVEHQIAELGRRMEEAVSGSHASAHFDDIASRLDTVQRTIETRAAAAPVPPLDTHALERLMSDIAAKLERPCTAPLAAPRFEKLLQSVSDRLETVAPAQPAQGMLAIQAELQRLADKIEADGLLKETSGVANDLRRDMAALAQRLDGITAAAQDASVIDALQAQVTRLADKIDTLNAASHDDAAAAQLRSEVSRLAQHGKDDSAMAGGGDFALLGKLQDKLDVIAQRLESQEDSARTLGALESTMSDLFRQIEDLRHAAVDAAEIAARKAARDALETGSTVPADHGGVAESLSRELADLRSLQSAADRRTHQTLTAVHETLERVVTRMAMLEDELGDVRTEPVTPTPSSATPRNGAPTISPSVGAAALPAFSHEPSLDDLIAPGSGGPSGRKAADVTALRLHLGDGDETHAQETSAQASFIAAARRAAQSSSNSGKMRPSDPAKRGSRSGNAIGDFLSQMRRGSAAKSAAVAGNSAAAKSSSAEESEGFDVEAGQARAKAKGSGGLRRPLLIALAGLLVILGSLQALRSLQMRHEQTAAAVETLPAANMPKPALPATMLTRPAPAIVAPAAPAPAVTTPETPQRDSALSPTLLGGNTKQLAAVTAPNVLPADAFDRTPIGSTPQQQRASTPPATSQPAMSLENAAAAGMANAQFELGSRLADGRGMTRDNRAAQQWFEKAAAQGLAPAQYRLGSLYERGMGVDRDLRRAYDWYSKAAAQGNVRAMHNLAVLNAEGVDGKPDYQAAASWFRKAAEYGVRDSQYNLAILYARGLGIEQNLPLSWAWFNAAALQGDEDAAKKRDDVAVRLDQVQLATAKTMAATFRAKTPDQAANEVALPANGWAATGPGQAQEDRPDARAAGKGKVSQL